LKVKVLFWVSETVFANVGISDSLKGL